MPRRQRPIWGVNLKRLLDATNKTATEIAASVGMSVQQFSNLMNDPELNPTVGTLQRCADAFGVPLAALFRSGSDDPEEQEHGRAVSNVEPLGPALKDALRDILADILVGLARSSDAPNRSLSSPRADKAHDGAIPARPKRAVS